jgi:hypothetical protein
MVGGARVEGYGKPIVQSQSAERGLRVTVWMFTVLSLTFLLYLLTCET